MAQFITKKSTTRQFRFVRVYDAPNKFIWLKRYMRQRFLFEPLPVHVNQTPRTLLIAFYNRRIFPYQDSVRQITDSMKGVGCFVSLDESSASKNNEYDVYKNVYLSGKLMFRARFTLRLKNNIISLTTFLKVYQPNHPFWQRYKLVLV